ncbi:cyclin-dependent kinase 11A [Protopterus annectens]|uniref:cyclin-dependent kinase 11A n=1 Tax=Protopterus annectens TaxID=7888 RepID=UPI001CFA71FE|nr:cyclin-dependent kinase 11A [Protopterus annectens]
MGDEKDTWKVKTLDEILQEKKRRKEQEEKLDAKRLRNTDDRDSKRDSLEEGELRDHRMEITIRNSPYEREDSLEERNDEDDSLSIHPPQQTSRKEKSHHRKEEKRKEKRRRRSHSIEGGKYMRVKEKDREHDRRKRRREEHDKARREWERQRKREMAREHSRRERDRLEQLERQREREKKMREQQQREQQRELKERERRAEERRKDRDSRREVSSFHRIVREDSAEKGKSIQRRFSPSRLYRERSEMGEGRKAAKEDKHDERDLLLDLQDISDTERKTSSGQSSSESATASEEEDDSSTAESEEEDEELETGSNSEEISEISAEELTEEEQSEEDEQENEHRGPEEELTEEEQSEEDEHENEHRGPEESRFDPESEESVEEEEEEVPGASPQSNAPTEGGGEYVPDSPPLSPVEQKKELPKYLPALQGCRSVEEFQCLNRIEEGTYGVVYRAKDKKTDEIVALKRLKMEKEKEGFPITSLREINTILKAQHPNIVTVREIVVGSNMDKIYIVMNYVEHDLKSLMETMKQPFLPGEVKTLMIQLLRGVRHLHDNWILHRDLKTSNLLFSHSGILKIGDFGLAREYGSPLKPYTPVVVTLWYRAPELLLGAKEYSTAIDLWSVGCIFGELLTQKPLFPGKSEIDQINKIFKDLGTPSEKIWPGYNELPAVKKMTFTEYPFNNLRKRFGALLSDQGFDLMNKFLTYCPAKRISAEEALKHEYFQETPLPIDPSMFPTWPAKSEQQRVKRGTSPRPPEGGFGYSQLGEDDIKDTGFHLTTTNQGASAAGPGFSLKF